MIYYVYAYYEPGRAEPFYIGKGHGNRAYEHMEPNVLKRYNDPFHKKLASMIRDGYKPEVHILADGLSESEALETEKQLILQFGIRLDGSGPLLNCTYGGDGVSGYVHSEESRAKIRAARARQRPWNQEEREAISRRMRGNKYAVGHKMPTRRRIAAQIFGITVKEYDFIAQVAEDNYHPANVSQALKGKRPTAYGFEWRYL